MPAPHCGHEAFALLSPHATTRSRSDALVLCLAHCSSLSQAIETPHAAQKKSDAPQTKSDADLVSELRSQLEAARRDAEAAIREAAASKEGAGHELALLRKQLDGALNSAAEATKVRRALSWRWGREGGGCAGGRPWKFEEVQACFLS